MAPSVLLVGASGALGVPLVKEFIKHKAKFGRLAILATEASKKAKFAEAEKGGFDVVVGGLLEASSYRGFEFVISLVGNPLLRLQPAMIDLAYSAGVKHIYPSEFGIDLSQESTFKHRYFRSKQDTRDHLIAKAKQHRDFHYTLFMNGGFTEWVVMGSLDQEKHVVTHFGKNDAPMQVTSIPDVVHYLVESILLPAPEQAREIRVAGEKTTIATITETLDQVLGFKHEISIQDPTYAESKQIEAWRAKDEAGQYRWALVTFITSGTAVSGEKLDTDRFDFKPETVEETIRRIFGKQ